MKIQIYTDDGYQQVDFNHVADEIDVVQLVELLHKNKVLSTSDVNSLLPEGFEVVEEVSFKNALIVVGQEAMCPDGLGRVRAFSKKFPNEFVQIDTYVDNRSCRWSPDNIQLIPVK